MRSTGAGDFVGEVADWRSAGLLYYRRSFHFRRCFGARIWRVSVDGGFDCPNRDGTRGRQGCLFCNPASFSPSRQGRQRSIEQQIEQGIRRIRARRSVDHFVAYFQPGTNTYAPAERLREVFQRALAHPEVVGLAIGTRPDCVADDVLDLLAELSQRTWLLLELGLQTIHNDSLDWLGRGHHYDAFLDAFARARQRGLQLAAHVILGLPGESAQQMQATAEELARLDIDAVKLHQLYAVEQTPLARLARQGQVRLAELEAYAVWVVDFLERLRPRCVIDRLSGEAPPHDLVGPAWSLDKSAVVRAVEAEFRRRGTRQGQRFRP